MKKEIKTKIKEKKLDIPKNKILLGVSGGIDSVVMAHIVAECGFNFAIAHCNYQLRGKESDKDYLFVKDLAEKLKVPFYFGLIETKELAIKNKLSIQEIARNARYEFFEKIATEHGYDFIAVGHNANDSTETVLLNLVRGSGIAAYHGIKAQNNKIIRPLLSFSRKEIEEHARKNKIKWREDLSNNSDDYTRNKIRHHVIPALQKINPSLNETSLLHMKHMQDVEVVYQLYIDSVKGKIINSDNNGVKILIEALLAEPIPETVLFELIKNLGFNRSQANDIFNSLNSSETKFFYADNIEIVKERKWIIIRLKTKTKSEITVIDNYGTFNSSKYKLVISKVRLTEKLKKQILSQKNKLTTQYFDAAKVSFPLTLRNKAERDFFYPLGMKGKKLLSDFFTDEKYSYSDKEKQLLLLTKNDVLWVVGKRMDDRFKITAQTKNILQIAFNDKR